jgi:hypothetical protein
MGRWSCKRTVEGCHSVSTKFLKDHDYFDGGVRSGRMSWNRNGQETGSIGLVVSIEKWNEYVRFLYTQTDRNTNEKTELDYEVQLSWTPCNFGGRRWWFICPLINNGHTCYRRVGALYLGGKYFGCRHCYNLTYTSCKEHDKRVDALRKNPELMMSFLNDRSLSKILLASKAAFKNIKGE